MNAVGRFGRRTGSKRTAAALAAGILATSLAVVGCIQPVQYGYDVWNYSSNRYVVRVSTQDGIIQVVVVPPRAIVFRHTDSHPLQAVVYDQSCSDRLASLELTAAWDYIVVDESGAMSAAPELAETRTEADLVRATSEPVPSSCPAGETRAPTGSHAGFCSAVGSGGSRVSGNLAG